MGAVVELHIGLAGPVLDLPFAHGGSWAGDVLIDGLGEDVLPPIIPPGLLHKHGVELGGGHGDDLGELGVIEVEILGELDGLSDGLRRLPGVSDHKIPEGVDAGLPGLLDDVFDLIQLRFL